MMCRLCAWLCDRFCPPGRDSKAWWQASYDWEDRYAADWEPAEEGEDLRQRWREARALLDGNPAAALSIHRELAEGGSAFSMLRAGWHHEYGRGTEVDMAAAEEFYRRALCAGSWRGTLYYARRLFERGAHDKWPSTLGDGVDQGFIPSFFWLAWYRYKRSPSRATAREVRHLLEKAAEAGHPRAALVLVRWMSTGKFGLREIPRGFRLFKASLESVFEGRNEPTDSSEPVLASGSASEGRPVREPDEVALEILRSQAG